MSNSLDFHKLQDINSNNLYAVVNINNMIPVPDKCATKLMYNEITKFREFKDDKDRVNYIYFLQREMAIINNIQSTLQNKTSRLYQKCIDSPVSSLASRCCNFVLLEKKCLEYIKE